MIFDVVTNKLFKALLDGTAKVGKAKDSEKLGGKGASEYALKTTVNGVEVGNGGSATVYSPSELASQGTTINAVGWYRIAEIRSPSASFLLGISRAYDSATPENYIVSVNFSNRKVTLGQLASLVQTMFITKVRVVHSGAHGYIEFYYNSTKENFMSVKVHNITFGKETTNTISNVAFTVGEIPDGYTATEFELSSSPIKASGIEVAKNAMVVMGVKRSDADNPVIMYYGKNGAVGGLGFSENGIPAYLTSDVSKFYQLLHSGNVGSYALPISGAVAKSPSDNNVVMTFQGMKNETVSQISFAGSAGTALGRFGFKEANTPVFITANATGTYPLHHDGNSAKVVFTQDSTTAPAADALWAHL